jgi:hypothetical protein
MVFLSGEDHCVGKETLVLEKFRGLTRICRALISSCSTHPLSQQLWRSSGPGPVSENVQVLALAPLELESMVCHTPNLNAFQCLCASHVHLYRLCVVNPKMWRGIRDVM